MVSYAIYVSKIFWEFKIVIKNTVKKQRQAIGPVLG